MMPVREVHRIAATLVGRRVKDWDNEGWRLQAACRGKDTSIFFPEDEDTPADDEAKEICAGCPVREQCLVWALSTHQPYGIFGGLTTTNRTRVQRRIRYAIEHPAYSA